MRWYRAFQMSDDGTTVTMKNGVRFGAGSSASPNTLAAGERGNNSYYTSSATTDTVYGRYCYLAGTGVGAEFIGGRDKVVLSAIAGNAHGNHSTVEVSSTGKVSGLCTGVRGNIVFATDTAVTSGTYYGVMAEIYAIGATGELPAGSNACLCISATDTAALNPVVNAIAFNGDDDTTSMIHTHTSASTITGYIRILVNGAIRYLPFVTTIS